jgi:hypothetical protein
MSKSSMKETFEEIYELDENLLDKYLLHYMSINNYFISTWYYKNMKANNV